MTEPPRSPRGVGLGALVLLLVGLFMGLWGAWEGFLFYAGYHISLMMALYVGCWVALLGAGVAGALLLVARYRPECARYGWRLAALVVLVVAALGGPVLAIARYAWILTA